LVRRHDDWNEWIRLLNRGDIGRGARNFSWLMIGNYASYALSLVTVVLIARALGPERYGGINAAVAYVGMFAFLKLPGFDKVFVRAVARDPSCESREYAVMLGAKAVAAAAGLVAAIAVLPFMPFSAGERASAAIFATTLLTQPIGSLIGGVFQAHEDMKWVAVVGLVRQTSYIVAATVALYGFGIHSIEVFVFLLSTSYWLGLVASVLLVRRHIARPLRAHFELPSREVLKAGVVFSLFSFVVFLYTKVDVLMARTLLGATAAGLYAVALNLLERANGPFMLMTTAFFPTICRRLQDGASVPPRQLGATMGVFAGVAAAVAAAVTALSGYLVPFVFGKSFSGSASVLTLLIWSLPAAMAVQPVYTVLQARGHEVFMLKAAAIRAAMNVGFNLVFVAVGMGITGIAVSSVVTSVLYLGLFSTLSFARLARDPGAGKAAMVGGTRYDDA
jgi:O-antigen/teichoic acid export membrane protein